MKCTLLLAAFLAFGGCAGDAEWGPVGSEAIAPAHEPAKDITPREVGKPPRTWRAASTGGGKPVATWEVVADTNAPSKRTTLSLTKVNHTSKSAFNICFTRADEFTDGMFSVSFKANSGKEDQGGGPIWRVQDESNYYVCRANPLEENFRLYVVKDGKRTQLASAEAKHSTGMWHTIEVEQAGDLVICTLNGRVRIEARDATIQKAGGVGVWTKADAATSFDNLIIPEIPNATKESE